MHAEDLSIEPVRPDAVQRIGLPKGVQPLAHLRETLGAAFGSADEGGRTPRVLVLTHRSPDPDALGALVGVEFLLRNSFGLDARVATVGKIHRAENQAMVGELDLVFEEYASLDTSQFAGAMLVDSQPSFGHTELPDDLPLLAVFDHHQPPPPERRARRIVPHYDVRIGTGSTAAIVYEYIRDAGLGLDSRTATALCCGVRFDTADLSVHATPLDREAFFETFRRADRSMLARIQRPALSPTYYRELHRSLSRARRLGPLVYGLLGRVQNPESVAEMADFFLRMEGCRWCLVGGAFESTYHLSLRTLPSHGDAYPLMERILAGEGSFGGRGSVAGGQVVLPGADDSSLRDLERRLRSRALQLVDPEELGGSDPRFGTRLTRLE